MRQYDDLLLCSFLQFRSMEVAFRMLCKNWLFRLFVAGSIRHHLWWFAIFLPIHFFAFRRLFTFSVWKMFFSQPLCTKLIVMFSIFIHFRFVKLSFLFLFVYFASAKCWVQIKPLLLCYFEYQISFLSGKIGIITKLTHENIFFYTYIDAFCRTIYFPWIDINSSKLFLTPI